MSSPEVLGQFIPLHYHYDMLRDNYRMTSFQQAIAATVQPGMTVVDLGGGTGVLSYFAAMQGAHVYYVERNPELVEVAKRFLTMNKVSDRVTIVHEDAAKFVPPVPVDVVTCEMLHVGLVREKQTLVIEQFKQNYVQAHGTKLPRFIPEASLLAIQPVMQAYEFAGFHAPVPLFQPPVATVDGTTELGLPAIYSTIVYDEAYPQRIDWKGVLTMQSAGTLNGWRVVTKNVLAVLVEEQSEICWHNQYLVVPIAQPLEVNVGDRIEVALNYEFCTELSHIWDGISQRVCPNSLTKRLAA
ncbi:methyltransferase domain-containing protein [Bremerella cremea]|uniref:methyltransferase domain-containing protein n=1 Tax=Bremerella cremea TaxID=1031537 RepID=UPI0031EE1AA2